MPSVCISPTVQSWRLFPLRFRLATHDMIAGDSPNVARQELEAFFRRREERGTFYCAGCLAAQLTQRGSRTVALAAWLATLEGGARAPRSATGPPAWSVRGLWAGPPLAGASSARR